MPVHGPAEHAEFPGEAGAHVPTRPDTSIDEVPGEAGVHNAVNVPHINPETGVQHDPHDPETHDANCEYCTESTCPNCSSVYGTDMPIIWDNGQHACTHCDHDPHDPNEHQSGCEHCEEAECPNCGDSYGRYDTPTVWSNGQHACTHCSGRCEDCEESVDPDDLNEVERQGYRRRGETRQICDDCFRNGDYFRCVDCDRRFSGDSYGGNTDGDPVCESCGENYFNCDSCNNTFTNDDYGEDGRCRECTREEDEEDEDEDEDEDEEQRRSVTGQTTTTVGRRRG